MDSEARLAACAFIGAGSGLIGGALDLSIPFSLGLALILIAFVITLDETRK